MAMDKHKDKLNRYVKEQVTDMFEKILDYSEIVVYNQEQYKKLRSKILRCGNDCVRKISKEVEMYYDVKYDPCSETVVEIIKE